VLEGGRIAARGDHAALVAASPLYREIVETELAGREEVAA